MIPIHEPGTGKLVGHYDPQTGRVTDASGRLLFRYDPKRETIELGRRGRVTLVPLGAIKDVGRWEYKSDELHPRLVREPGR